MASRWRFRFAWKWNSGCTDTFKFQTNGHLYGGHFCCPKTKTFNYEGHEVSRRFDYTLHFLRVTSCPWWLVLPNCQQLILLNPHAARHESHDPKTCCLTV